MSNINDYLIWRGDIKIDDQYKFNEIDNMILARFSYLLFDKIDLLPEEKIESISKKMKDFPNEDFNYNGDKELITNLGQSERFKNLIVSDFIKNTDSQTEKQFSAITIHISKEELYISFVGTDGSLIGWKEDFNISFMENIPSQIAGLEYTKMIAKKYPNKKIRIGGHSKGGNISVYVALNAPKEIQDKIIGVVNYDGPGFDKEKFKKHKDKEIINRIFTYIPQDSIIGRILEHEEKYEVILSTEKGIYQHDIYSWQIERDKMIRTEKATDASERMYKTIKKWLKNTTPDQRKIFFDSIFEVFFSTQATTFGEISSSWMRSAPKLFESYKGLSEEDRKNIIDMLKLFGKLYISKK